MKHRHAWALTTVALVLTTGLAPATAGAAPPGGPGIGDPYFPQDGNGGYRVSHYDLTVRYEPISGHLQGRAVLAARATQTLTRFDLDLRLRASRVTVDGRPAAFHRERRHELVIRSRRPIADGSRFRVVVRYGGVPEDVTVDGFTPWISPHRPAFVNGEPHHATVWFPVNDHPSDKATYDLTAVVPTRWQAVGAGRLVGHRTLGHHSRWHWRMDDPMPSYQTFLGLGHYRIVKAAGSWASGSYAWSSSFSPGLQHRIRVGLSHSPAYVRWLSARLGPYPFHHLGGVVQGGFDVPTIESQTAPVYGRYVFRYAWPEQARRTMVHELAHQWFGGSVTMRRWRYLWLSEGFATYLGWWYDAAHGGPSLDEQMMSAYDARPADDHWWTIPPGNPGPRLRTLFTTVYDRGAMTLQALRNRIGDRHFEQVLRRWVRTHRHATATTREFVHLAESVSGQGLGRFFRVWLFEPQRPARTSANGFPTG